MRGERGKRDQSRRRGVSCGFCGRKAEAIDGHACDHGVPCGASCPRCVEVEMFAVESDERVRVARHGLYEVEIEIRGKFSLESLKVPAARGGDPCRLGARRRGGEDRMMCETARRLMERADALKPRSVVEVVYMGALGILFAKAAAQCECQVCAPREPGELGGEG
jgi:hypothetical protein